MNNRVRGRVSLYEGNSMETAKFLGEAYLDDTGPGGTITYEGKRYEVVRNVFWSNPSSTIPSCWLVKSFNH